MGANKFRATASEQRQIARYAEEFWRDVQMLRAQGIEPVMPYNVILFPPLPKSSMESNDESRA